MTAASSLQKGISQAKLVDCDTISSGEVNTELAENGWAAVSRSHARALQDISGNEHTRQNLKSVKVSCSKVAEMVFEYAKVTLAERTSNPSMRV